MSTLQPSARNFHEFANIVVIVLAGVVFGIISASRSSSNAHAHHPASIECDGAEDAVREERNSDAIGLLSRCLSSTNLDSAARARALKLRAFAHYKLERHADAVVDQEAAFTLEVPTRHGDFINYSLYLRLVGRLDDSLRAVQSADAMERKSGSSSMMTQYHLGWVLLELGKPRDAVAAFSRGLPFQPNYPFAYWRRGLAYEALGEKEKARDDFVLAAKHFSSAEQRASAGDLLPVIETKLHSYGIALSNGAPATSAGD